MTRDEQILSLKKLVSGIAKRVSLSAPYYLPYADLCQAGWIAAIRCVDTFDPERGVPLEMYARRIISGAMLNEIRSNDLVSERARRIIRQAMRQRGSIVIELGRELSIDEMDERFPGYRKAVEAVGMLTPLNMDEPIEFHDYTVSRHDALPGKAINPLDAVAEDDDKARLHAIIDGLPPPSQARRSGILFQRAAVAQPRARNAAFPSAVEPTATPRRAART